MVKTQQCDLDGVMKNVCKLQIYTWYLELGSIEDGFESRFQEKGVALRCKAEGESSKKESERKKKGVTSRKSKRMQQQKAREDSKNKSKEDVSESMSMGNIHIGGLESHLLDVPDLELARSFYLFNGSYQESCNVESKGGKTTTMKPN
ncbi:hypothetical protein Tco_0210668 [Tanacetum coccineum]